jgi:hypothetical protein
MSGAVPLSTAGERKQMRTKAVISLTTGLEDPEKVTVAFLVAVAAAEQGRRTLMFLTKEAVRLGIEGRICSPDTPFGAPLPSQRSKVCSTLSRTR